jgi:hypothetical protein
MRVDSWLPSIVTRRRLRDDTVLQKQVGWMIRTLVEAVFRTLVEHGREARARGRPCIEEIAEDSQIVRVAYAQWLDNQGELPNITMPSLFIAPEAVNEAYFVVKTAGTVFTEVAIPAINSILDATLEGAAIIPGSADRRELFEWWLYEAVPASWLLRFPNKIWTIKGKVPSEECVAANNAFPETQGTS